MAFTRSQQPAFRRLVDAAAHALSISRTARRAWYESELLASVGFSSTLACDPGRDYDVAMAHFEALADNGETAWQVRAETGDFKRVMHAVFGRAPREIDGEPITEHYVRGIAKQALRRDHLPALRTLSKPQLNIVIKALAIHRARNAEQPSP